MARAHYAVIPRSLFDDERFLCLTDEAAHLLLRVYGTCDRYGRFPASPVALARRTGLMRGNVAESIAEIASAGLSTVYEVDGAKIGELAVYGEVMTARMMAKRGAPEFPECSGPLGAPESTQVDPKGPLSGPLGDPQGTAGQPIAQPEPSLSPDVYDTHAGARARDTTLTRGIAAGKALAATPEPDPLPADLEALALALLDRVATLRHKHGKFAEVGKDLAGTRLLVEVSAGAEVRAMAREYPDACRELVPRALEQGDKFRLGKGLARPNCLSYLRAAVIGWTASESTNGRAVAPPVGPPRGGYMVPEWGDSDA